MKQIKCPACGEKFTKLDGLHDHIEEEHSELIPEGYTAQRFIYYNKTGKTHGSCVICKKDTEWNETTGKYKRFCNNPKCKEEYREIFKQRMTGKYGKTTLLNEPEQQKKMLAHRHISGEYKWTDGTFKTYTGSYELDFLRFLDLFMNMDSDDVITPSPHTYYYIYEGEKKFYIPDVYIPSLNLEIEIKDGGNNPNMHGKIQAVDKVKEKLKDEVLNTTKDIDYIKIVNKEYDTFFEYLVKKKDEVAGAKNVRISGVMENTIVTEGSFDYKKACMNAPIEESEELNKILYNAYENGSIGVATDWHLFEYDEDTHTVYRNKRTMHTIDAINNMVDNNDVLIYLGDLVSDECQNKEELRKLLQSIKCTKILIKGNNDLFSDEFYKSCGFIYVGYKFVWEDILFSHMPVENDYLMNVHGHIHGSKEYWIKYTNQIDAYREDGLPYNINDLVRGFKEYSRTVTVKSDYDKVNTVTESIEYEPVMEVSNISKDNDNYYDFERFVNGDSNILLITGLEASNTTKVAREYTELFNAEYINLDLFTTTSINNILDGDNKGTASSWYINQIQTFAQSKLTMDPENRNHILKPTREQTVAFIKTLFGNLSASKKYVIEGIAFYRYEELDFITMEYPLIVKHDSLKSTLNNYKTQSYLNIFTILYDEILDKKESKNWFKNEKDKLNEFSRRTLEYRSDIKHMRYEKGVYPVYVVLMHSGSGLATAIKKVTGDEFTHASISFDPTLRNMYSFGKKYDSDIMEMGLIREDANSAFLHRPIDFALYVTFVDADEFKAMKHTFYEVLKREKELRYSFVGLVKYALGMDAETKNRMFCSEFVAHVLNSKYNNTDGYYSSQVRPEDFKSFENFKLVQRGKLSDYDPSVTIARVSRMKKPTK